MNVFGTLSCNNNLNQHFFVLVRRKNALVRSFKHGISGFAARLTAPEAQSIAKKPGVVSVFPDPVYHLHTTRSWDFLKYGTGLEIISSPNSDSNLFSQGSDTSVGFLDSVLCNTGIWPESESFNDKDLSPNTIALERNDRSYIKLSQLNMKGVHISIQGEAMNFANIGKSPLHPLMSAMSAKNTYAGENEAINRNPDSMVGDMIKGKIVICENDDDTRSQYVKKEGVQSLGGVDNFMEFQMTVISSKDAAEVLAYIDSTNFAAPEADNVAAWKVNDTEVNLRGTESPQFNVISGTSMSCPHVSAMIAVVKPQYPSWSPSAIKSAITTTASQINNTKDPITKELGAIATAYDYGAGEISTTGPLQPVISKDVPGVFSCPKDSSVDLMSNINYPSISASNLTGFQSRTINRTLTNVAGDAPSGLIIAVSPTSLRFTKYAQRLSYQVIFTPTISSSQAFYK
ncbi:hypothetical protein BDE02_02G017600 [Populus trichocarpa]|nr:hypothetical protein BDE02_02G017600 [Populus trichocarpa]